MILRQLCIISFISLSLGVSLTACSKSGQSTPQQSSTEAEGSRKSAGQSHEGHGAHKSPVTPQQGKVALSAEGVSFKPPIQAEALPSGAYYCDMGTVHYARSEQGDGVCPVCKMKLSHKP